MTMFAKSLLAISTVLAIAGSASATVIDFNDKNNGVYWVASVTSNGYLATQNTINWGMTPMGTNVAVDGWGVANNGTVHLDSWTNVGTDSVWTLSKVGGGAFNLLGFDIGSGYQGGSGAVTSLTLTGNLVGGGTVSQVFNGLSQSFQTLSVTSQFYNLSSVTFNAYGPNNRAAFDNIVVSVGAPAGGSVPEPASLGLMGLGLAGLGAMRRNRKSA